MWCCHLLHVPVGWPRATVTSSGHGGGITEWFQFLLCVLVALCPPSASVWTVTCCWWLEEIRKPVQLFSCCSALTKLAKLAGEKLGVSLLLKMTKVHFSAWFSTYWACYCSVSHKSLHYMLLNRVSDITEDRRIIFISSIFPVWMWHTTPGWQ